MSNNHIKTVLVLVHPIYQKSTQKSKILNKITRFTICENIRALKPIPNFLSKCNTMTDTNKLYLRVRSETLEPKLVYWYINRQFYKGNIPNKDGYLLEHHLLNHIVHSQVNSVPLSSVCEVVNNMSHANFSIGRQPQNFGDMELLNGHYITVKR